MSEEVAAQIAELRGRLIALEGRTGRLEDDLKHTLQQLSDKLDSIMSRMDRADGALAFAAHLGSWAKPLAAAAFTGAAAWVAAHFGWLG